MLSVLTCCLVITGSQEEDFNNFSDPEDFTFEKISNQTEQLPTAAARLGAEARNYVAYIPVPINDDEEGEEYDEEEYDDDEYYDDEYEEYYEEEEEKPSKKKKKGKRKSGPSRRRHDPSKSGTEEKERVPFLVPLMMVPENQVGVQKEFSFSKESNDRVEGVGDDDGVFTSILNLNNKRRPPPPPPLRRNSAPSRLSRPRSNGIPSRSIHSVPGPPYRGPPPRNPNLPLDKTVIHPSIHRPRLRRPPRNFRPRAPNSTPSTSTSTTTEMTTTETVSVTKSKPNIIVVQQQPSYSPYQPYRPPYNYNPYPPVYPPYPYPYPSTPSTTPSTTTSTTTTTIKTTTAKAKKKRKKKKKKPSAYNANLSDDQITSLSQPQLTIVDNKVVPVMNKQQQSILKHRFGLQARRFNQPFKVRGRRRLPGSLGGSQSSSLRGPYRDHRQQDRPNRRFDMPNIFTQSGFPYDKYEDERPIISRPPPRHPGVRVPGVRVPANAGSIEDIISPKPVRDHNNNYRPPVKNVVHVQYEEPPRRPDHKYQRPAQRPQPSYEEETYYEPPDNEYGPVVQEPPRRPDQKYQKPAHRPHLSSTYDDPPHRPYHPPHGPPPSNDYDYRPPPAHEYEKPPRPKPEYDYRPDYEDPPPRPPPSRPPPSSYEEESYYEPPDNEYGPIVHDYQPPKPPSQYRPPNSYYETTGQSDGYRPQPENVVPPAYNQDYYLTPDPQNDVYPGPDIYDGGSVHGPDNGDRKVQSGYPAAPTLGPPTRQPYSYEPPTPPRVQAGYRPRPNDISSGVDHVDKFGFESDGHHPDGPDYSSGTLINSYKGSAPFKVGLDLYPIEGVSPLGSLGKQDIYSSVIPHGLGGDDNKHEILLHLNLFSKKPSIPGGRSGGRSGSRAEDIDIDSPSLYRR